LSVNVHIWKRTVKPSLNASVYLFGTDFWECVSGALMPCANSPTNADFWEHQARGEYHRSSQAWNCWYLLCHWSVYKYIHIHIYVYIYTYMYTYLYRYIPVPYIYLLWSFYFDFTGEFSAFRINLQNLPYIWRINNVYYKNIGENSQYFPKKHLVRYKWGLVRPFSWSKKNISFSMTFARNGLNRM